MLLEGLANYLQEGDNMRRILTLTALLALTLAFATGCGNKAEETAMQTCGACDMEMAESAMVEKDGKWYCEPCIPTEEAGETDETEEAGEVDEHAGHDHG